MQLRRVFGFVVFISFSLPLCPISAAPGDENWDGRFSLPGLDGPVYALATDGTNLFAGGWFTYAGPVLVNNLARWDGSNWWAVRSANNGEPGLSGTVSAIAVSGSNVFVGGAFNSAGAIAATNIARWDGHNWSPLGSGANSDVVSILVRSDTVYAGGAFTSIGGVNANGVAKWTGTTWAPLGSGVDGMVWALAVNGNDLYAGGTFQSAGGKPIAGLARWDGSDWSQLGAGLDGYVRALTIRGSELFAGGKFATAGGNPAHNVARWNGTTWSALGNGLDDEIEAMVVIDQDLYLKGRFFFPYGAFDPHLNGAAKWDGANWSTIGEGTGWYSNGGALAAIGNDLYAGGDPYNRRLMSRWNGIAWSNLLATGSLGPVGEIRSIAVSGRKTYVGGAFSNVGDLPLNNLAQWDGTNWSAWAEVNGLIDHIVATSNFVYVAGGFTEIAGAPITNVAKWDGANWSALGDPPSGPYAAFAAAGPDVYVANMASAPPFGPYIYKWDGTNWAPLGGGIFGAYGIEVSIPVRAFAIDGNDVYMGGLFLEVGGVRATNLARWDGTQWWPVGGGLTLDAPFSTTVIVSSLAIRNHELFVGGQFNRAFTQTGFTTVNNIAKWDGTNWSALGNGIGDISSLVQAMAVSGDNLYVGGYLEPAGGHEVHGIAQWNGKDWSTLGSGVDGSVNTLAVSGSDLFVGGQFSFAGGKPASSFSIWHIPQALQFSRAAGLLHISWPTQAVDFKLQTTCVLPTSNWIDVPQKPQTLDTRFTVTNNLQGSNGFFRLRRPY